jgi:SPP1 family predicted phage head-tail adaptor
VAPAADTTWGSAAGDSTTDGDEVWASVIGRSGTETLKDEGVASTVIYDVTMRYRLDVTSTNRLLWRGLILEIVSVIADEKRTQLTLECKVTT